jgi:uncharacterized membrane protein YqjE
MVDQTKMNRANGHGDSQSTLNSTRSAARNMAHLLHDAVTLGELQFRLFVVDCQQFRSKLTTPIIAIAIGLVLAVFCVPVALAGIALLFHDAAGLSRLASVWITFGLTLVVGAICIGCGVWWLQSAGNAFESSRVELTQNIERLKEMLRRSSHPTQNPRAVDEPYSAESRYR